MGLLQGYINDDVPLNMETILTSDLNLQGYLYIESDFDRKLIACIRNNDIERAKETFRFLKQAYNKIGKYEEEDLAYYEFKKCETNEFLEDSRNVFKKGYLWLNRKVLQDCIGGYGTRPLRTLRAIPCFWFIFSLFFGLTYNLTNSSGIPPQYVGHISNYTTEKSVYKDSIIDSILNEKLLQIEYQYQKPLSISKNKCVVKELKNYLLVTRLCNSMRISAMNILTLGFTGLEYSPFCFFILSLLENLLGLFLIAYFTIAFARKVLR